MSSGLEASIAGAETHMLGELSYALPASAQYMKKREEIYWTSGANVYAANGIRTMRVNISGQGFLDMSSLVLECDVDNLSTAAPLKPLVPGLEGFFQSLKVSISGTTVEEIGDPSCSYGRIYTMLSKGLPKEKIAMNGAMGFELDPNATITEWRPRQKRYPLAVRRRSCINHLLVFATKKCSFPYGQSAHLVKVLASNFKSFRMQLHQLTPPMEVVCGNYPMLESMEMSCTVMKVCKTLMRGIC